MSSSILQSVLDAMQEAENIGGPVGLEYIELMDEIAREAKERADTCREVLAESAP